MRDGSSAPLPYLELLAAVAWWTVGSAALDRGVGTVVLAAGLVVAGMLFVAVRRRPGPPAPLPPGSRARLARLGVAALGAIAGVVVLVNALDIAELTFPAVCMVLGVAFLPLASLLAERLPVAVGGVLVGIGAAGGMAALDSAGLLIPQGVVGLVAGALLWATAAVRTGVLLDLRARSRG